MRLADVISYFAFYLILIFSYVRISPNLSNTRNCILFMPVISYLAVYGTCTEGSTVATAASPTSEQLILYTVPTVCGVLLVALLIVLAVALQRYRRRRRQSTRRGKRSFLLRLYTSYIFMHILVIAQV